MLQTFTSLFWLFWCWQREINTNRLRESVRAKETIDCRHWDVEPVSSSFWSEMPFHVIILPDYFHDLSVLQKNKRLNETLDATDETDNKSITVLMLCTFVSALYLPVVRSVRRQAGGSVVIWVDGGGGWRRLWEDWSCDGLWFRRTLWGSRGNLTRTWQYWSASTKFKHRRITIA